MRIKKKYQKWNYTLSCKLTYCFTLFALTVNALWKSNKTCHAGVLLSLRAQFPVENEPISHIHGSEDQEAAEREISFFFPKQNTLAVIKHEAMEQHRGASCFSGIACNFRACLKDYSSNSLLCLKFHRNHFGGDPWQRFLCDTAEGDGAVQRAGWGALQRAQGEAFLHQAGGLYLSVSLYLLSGTGSVQRSNNKPIKYSRFISESRQPRKSVAWVSKSISFYQPHIYSPESSST